VNITVTTLKPRLARFAGASSPATGFAAGRRLKGAARGGGCMWAFRLRRCCRGLRERGRGTGRRSRPRRKRRAPRWFWSGVLFLMPAIGEAVSAVHRGKISAVGEAVSREWYSKKRLRAGSFIARRFRSGVARIRQKFGFATRPWEGERPKRSAGSAIARLGRQGWLAGNCREYVLVRRGE